MQITRTKSVYTIKRPQRTTTFLTLFFISLIKGRIALIWQSDVWPSGKGVRRKSLLCTIHYIIATVLSTSFGHLEVSCADLILGFLLVLIIFFQSEHCTNVPKSLLQSGHNLAAVLFINDSQTISVVVDLWLF